MYVPLLRLLPMYVITVKGNSMSPTLKENRRSIVLNLPLFKYQKNDLVVCLHPQTTELLIKRIHKTLSDDTYFVVGDNLKQSTDSRSFGPIKRNQIYGKILI